MTALLNAPCVFCGYNGHGYFQVGTHSKSCPWHYIGGEADREAKLGDVIARNHYEADILRSQVVWLEAKIETLKRQNRRTQERLARVRGDRP